MEKQINLISLKCFIYRIIRIIVSYSILILKQRNYKKTPIIINNYNRLSFLKRLIASLEIRGYNNIYIIDNNSTYPPLLNYYKSCKYTIYRLKENKGYKAIWETNIYKKFKKSLYVYTDSDMEIDQSCPDDFIKRFISIHLRYPSCEKVGFGLRIDDLPDSFIHKKEVIKHEKHFWKHEISPNVFRANIDTTFALYKPFCCGPNLGQEAYRTGKPYLIRHLPWYIDSNNLDEEELYYLQHISQSSFWSQKINEIIQKKN